MRIFLCTPPQPGTWLNRWKQVVHGLMPPLGLAYLVSVVERAGHEVEVVDSAIEGLGQSELLHRIKRFAPEMVGISAMTPVALEAFRLAAAIKRDIPGVPVILGGSHPTCYPEQCTELCPVLDAIVIGEGEDTMIEIINAYTAGHSLSAIPGIIFRDGDGGFHRNPARSTPVSLDHLPMPAYHRFPIGRYRPEPFDYKFVPSTQMICSRGCIYAHCTYCNHAGSLRRQYRIKSPEKAIAEIVVLIEKHLIKDIAFVDDDLLTNRLWLKKFSSLIEQRQLSFAWSCTGRCNSIDRTTLELVRDAGCWGISFGFESGNQLLLDRIKKGITLDQGRKVSKWAHELGLELFGSFMLALPGETPQMGRQTIDFAIELDCSFATFIPTHPMVGTELYEECLGEGRLISPIYNGKKNQNRYIPNICYVPTGYRDEEEIRRILKLAYRKFYLRGSYLAKHLGKIRSSADILRYISGLRFFLDLY